MNIRVPIFLCILSPLSGALSSAAAADWRPAFPATLPANTWLGTHQRLCFGIDGKSLDEAIKDGTNVICGGTNAAGIGFAGGPVILGKNGEFVDIMSGDPIPEQTLAELRARVDAAHAQGARVLGEVIRFNMTPWLQAEHPDWQDINSPGGKPIADITISLADTHAAAAERPLDGRVRVTVLYARIFFNTCPRTSVSRKSRPWNL